MAFKDFQYRYTPILSVSLSETSALKELPNKDKDIVLPVFPIKSWVTAKKLISAIERIEDSIGKNRKWIADLDYEDLMKRPLKKYNPVHHDIKKLMDSSDGYANWCEFVGAHANIIPCLQIKELKKLELQVSRLSSLRKGVVLRLKISDLESTSRLNNILNSVAELENIFIIVDLEQIDRDQIKYISQIETYIEFIKNKVPMSLISVSSTSFPDSFGGYYKNTKSIYERALFDKLVLKFPSLVYSDRGGARATKLSGGGGTPPPRIDYAQRNEWHFIRKEFEQDYDDIENSTELRREEKKELYTQIAQEVVKQGYWENDLKVWANYVIELTAKGDDFGINSAQKATAVRINKHLFTQLHYSDDDSDIKDTDDDWED